MAIGERIHFFRLLRGMTQNISVCHWDSRRSLLMCALHSTKQDQEPPKQT